MLKILTFLKCKIAYKHIYFSMYQNKALALKKTQKTSWMFLSVYLNVNNNKQMFSL